MIKLKYIAPPSNSEFFSLLLLKLFNLMKIN
jgi:hypothetical protein